MHDGGLQHKSNHMTAVVNAIKEPKKATTGRPDLILIGCALLAMYVPTYHHLDKTVWGVVGQGHGPVMLALSMWLAWQRFKGLKDLPEMSNLRSGWIMIVAALVLYMIGRSQDILMLDVGSQIPLLAGILLLYRGWSGVRVMWFPLFFLLFLVPLPSALVDAVTAPLKSAVSNVAGELLYLAGFPVGREGVLLTVGPYKLLVADACAGLNSIFALEAVGVFYLSLMEYKSKLRNILLAILVLPISFVSNVIRVIALVLVTYYFGDEVGQGFVHDFAGIFLFIIATVLTISVDQLVGFFVSSESRVDQLPKEKI